MTAPTLINLPPPSSTPSDFGPGTPNSFTSTVALKDGVEGSAPPHHISIHAAVAPGVSVLSVLDAERADRISRVAGLERVATLRGATQHLPHVHAPYLAAQPKDYFNSNMPTPESSVSGASASDTADGKMIWTSESADYAQTGMDKPSDRGGRVSSNTASSDEANSSLTGFEKPAGDMTVPTDQVEGKSVVFGTGAKNALATGIERQVVPCKRSGRMEGTEQTDGQEHDFR